MTGTGNTPPSGMGVSEADIARCKAAVEKIKNEEGIDELISLTKGIPVTEVTEEADPMYEVALRPLILRAMGKKQSSPK